MRRRRWPPWVWLRLLWADFIRHGMLGSSGEMCQDCGRPMGIIWHAEDALWVEVVGSRAGLLCPRCFDRRSKDLGLRVVFFAKAGER